MSKIARRPDAEAIDQEIGSRICQRRMLLGMSRETLGARIGVRGNQIANYEKAEHRVGAGRLAVIARVLEMPLLWFFGEGETVADLGALKLAGRIARLRQPEQMAVERLIDSFERNHDLPLARSASR